jgi:hypothetical protein
MMVCNPSFRTDFIKRGESHDDKAVESSILLLLLRSPFISFRINREDKKPIGREDHQVDKIIKGDPGKSND